MINQLQKLAEEFEKQLVNQENSDEKLLRINKIIERYQSGEHRDHMKGNMIESESEIRLESAKLKNFLNMITGIVNDS